MNFTESALFRCEQAEFRNGLSGREPLSGRERYALAAVRLPGARERSALAGSTSSSARERTALGRFSLPSDREEYAHGERRALVCGGRLPPAAGWTAGGHVKGLRRVG